MGTRLPVWTILENAEDHSPEEIATDIFEPARASDDHGRSVSRPTPVPPKPHAPAMCLFSAFAIAARIASR